VFREEHAKDAAERFKIEQALRVADFDAEIELLFQPQFSLGQNEITRAEALARWDSPILGEIGPDRFIKIAEESGLIASITLSVLEKAIAALKSWQAPIPLSINLSGHDLISDQIINQIIQMIKDSDLEPSLLEFEVTETAMMADTQKASNNLLRLTELGHPVALDDFGTGYSNFNYLRTLPISKLKVDRSFMQNLTDPMTEKILHSLSGMARTLDVECLLEGIENELELIMAKRVGAQSVQGYLFGMPMSANELVECLEAQSIENQLQDLKKIAGK
ncbi:MAG: EAL domain-containing protein, partial [Parasphingorhabdus sp.]